MGNTCISGKNWYIEFLTPYEAHMHGLGRIAKNVQTKYQNAKIIDTLDYGRCLFLDGKIQSAQIDEFIYHEALVHPALFLHPKPERIFVGGGGEGAILREILKHPTVKKVIMVDIDKKVVDLCRKYLFQWHNGKFDDPRVKLYYQDAQEFLKKEKDTFDCIFLDICDPEEAKGPSALLFTKKFFTLVKKKLSQNGIVAVQSGSTNLNMLKYFSGVFRSLKAVFPFVLPYQAYVPSFVGPWGFNLASAVNMPRLLDQGCTIKKRLRGKLRFYSPEVHNSLFVLPDYLKKSLKKGKVIDNV